MSLSPRVHDWNMNGPVPVGCCVAYVPVGWKTPFDVDAALVRAVLRSSPSGSPCENDGSDSAPRNDADGSVRLIVMLELLFTLQLLKRLPFGAPDFGSYFLNPPKTVCQ